MLEVSHSATMLGGKFLFTYIVIIHNPPEIDVTHGKMDFNEIHASTESVLPAFSAGNFLTLINTKYLVDMKFLRIFAPNK